MYLLDNKIILNVHLYVYAIQIPFLVKNNLFIFKISLYEKENVPNSVRLETLYFQFREAVFFLYSLLKADRSTLPRQFYTPQIMCCFLLRVSLQQTG